MILPIFGEAKGGEKSKIDRCVYIPSTMALNKASWRATKTMDPRAIIKIVIRCGLTPNPPMFCETRRSLNNIFETPFQPNIDLKPASFLVISHI